jgi:hypothetical protein
MSVPTEKVVASHSWNLCMRRVVVGTTLWAAAVGCVTRNEVEVGKSGKGATGDASGQAKARGETDQEHVAAWAGVVDSNQDDASAFDAGDASEPRGAAAAAGASGRASGDAGKDGKRLMLPPPPTLGRSVIQSPTKPFGDRASAKTGDVESQVAVETKGKGTPAGSAPAKVGLKKASASAFEAGAKGDVKAASGEAPKAKRDVAVAKVTAAAASEGESRTVTVRAQAVNVRSEPNMRARVVGRLTRGTKVPAKIEGRWAKIGEYQYVLAKFLRSGN